MPDISKCNGEGCPVRDKCYRFTSTPDHWQSYAAFDKSRQGESGCDDFWDNSSYSPKESSKPVTKKNKKARK